MTTELEPGARPLQWPERLMLRDVYADKGQRIFTTATGHGYDKCEYVRADLSALSAPEAAHPGAATHRHKKRGTDDPEERCPRPPHECTCWEVDLDHPTARVHITPRPAAPTDGDIGALVATVEAELAKGVMSPMDWNTSNTVLVRKLLDALAAMSAKLDEAETERDAAKFDLALQRGRTQIAEAKLAEAERERANLAIDLSGTAYRKIEAEDSVRNLQAANADLRRRVDAMDKALQEIADQHLHNIALDPGWPQRIARAARASGGSDA